MRLEILPVARWFLGQTSRCHGSGPPTFILSLHAHLAPYILHPLDLVSLAWSHYPRHAFWSSSILPSLHLLLSPSSSFILYLFILSLRDHPLHRGIIWILIPFTVASCNPFRSRLLLGIDYIRHHTLLYPFTSTVTAMLVYCGGVLISIFFFSASKQYAAGDDAVVIPLVSPFGCRWIMTTLYYIICSAKVRSYREFYRAIDLFLGWELSKWGGYILYAFDQWLHGSI